MNRRSFLGKLFGGLAAAAVASSAPLNFLFPKKEEVYATIGEYNNYASFSDLEIAAATDEIVSKCATELGYQAALTFNAMYAQAYDSL